jgi:putative ABC transport system permease protein
VRGERLYELLIRLYPPAFRHRHASELMAFFRRHRTDPRFGGRRGALRFWRHTVGDALRTATSEWFATWRRTAGGRRRNDASAAHRSRGLLRGVAYDIRYAARTLTRDPLFTGVSVLTLALGIGATTSVFTVVRGVLLEPLGFPNEDRLVRVYEYERDNPDAQMVAYGNYSDLRDAAVFDELAIWAYGSHTVTGTERAVQLRTREVSSNFAATLGMSPVLGRWINNEEEREGRRVVVLSHALWQTVFGGAEDVTSRSILLDREPYAIIGVMGPGFEFPSGAEAWVPLAPVTNPTGLRRWHRHNMVGRLPSGVSPREMNLRLVSIAQRLEDSYPDTNAGNYFEARPLVDTLVGQVRPALRILFGAVTLLLLIACANVASLMHARYLSRDRELAVRTALGASSFRLGRLLLVEAALLAGVGGGGALLVARLGLIAVLSSAAGSIPRMESIGFNPTVFLFALGVSAITAVTVAAVPLLRARRRARAAAATLHGAHSSENRSPVRSRRVLVAAELACALVLTVGAGLLVRSFNAMVSVEPGIELDRLLALDLRLPGGDRYATGEEVARFVEDLNDNLEAVPGVEHAAVVLTQPVDDRGWFNALTIRDRPLPEPQVPPIGYNVVSSGYFETVGARLLEGRTFTRDEPLDGHRVGVINRRAAERHWSGESPVGKLVLGNVEADSQWVEVIGVIDDVRQSLTDPTHPEIYVPIAQDRVLSFTLLARTRGEPTSVARSVESEIRKADRDIPISSVQPFLERVNSLVARPRFSAMLMGSFAGLALILACVGVFGLLAFTVTQRRREFGIRMALGAKATRVVRAVLRDAVLMGAAALVLGLAGSLLLSRLLTSLLFGVAPTDLVSFATASGAILLVTLGAALWPALTATRVDPMAVLREE